jgi:hypothetical protein
MGYRWHNGRLLSDEEYSDTVIFEGQIAASILGFMIPFFGLGLIGINIGNGIGALIGFPIGGIIGYIFNSFLTKLAKLIVWALIIGVIVFIIYTLSTAKY